MAKGSVFKRCQCKARDCRKKHGSWSFAFDVGRDSTTGKRKQHTESGFPTKPDAEAAMHAAMADFQAGAWTDDKGVTAGQFLKSHLEDIQGRIAVKTMNNYRTHIRDVWIPRIGSMRLRDLRRHHVDRVLREMSQPVTGERPTGNVGRRVKSRSAATINGYRRTLRAALAAAKRQGLITLNPAEGRMDSIPKAEHHEPVIWEPHDTAKFLEHVSTDRLAALYELAAYAGLRRAELCGLRWSDIDDDGAGLTVQQTLIEVSTNDVTEEERQCRTCGGDHGGRLFKEPKSRTSRRWVPLVAAAQAALAAHRASQLTERESFGRDYADHGLIFCEVDGNPLRPGLVSHEFDRHGLACGLPRIRLHDTRHGAASLLLSGGVPIEVVQMIMGHSSPSVTRAIYAHVMKRATAAQVEAASEALTRYRREQSVSSSVESEGLTPKQGKDDAMS